MKFFRLNVLFVIAGILLLTIPPAFAKAAFEFDGMAIDISQAEFIKMRPAAKTLSIRPNEYQSFFYSSKNYSFSGFSGSTLSRIFVKGKGCAASVSFDNLPPGKREDLIRAIQSHHLKKTAEENLENTNGGRFIYFEGGEVYAAVFLEDGSDSKSSKRLVHTVSLKSCGPDFARMIQVLPR